MCMHVHAGSSFNPSASYKRQLQDAPAAVASILRRSSGFLFLINKESGLAANMSSKQKPKVAENHVLVVVAVG